MRNALIRLIGWKATILHADPLMYDRWKWLKRHLQPGPLRIFDAGCGNGAFTMYAAKIGNRSVGMSFDKKRNRISRFRADILGIDNIEFIDGDLKKLDKISEQLGKFDQIICFETIEHIMDDKKFIEDLSNLLKPSGRLLLTAPYKYCKGLFGLKVSKCEDGGHVRKGYTHSQIREIFNRYGLDVQLQDYISGFISQQLTSLMYLLDKIIGKIASWVIIFPLRGFQILDIPFTRIINYPYFSIGVIGIKPSQ